VGFFHAGCVNHSVFRILFACLFVFAGIFSGINLKDKVASRDTRGSTANGFRG